MMGRSVYPFAIPYVYGSRLSEIIPSRAMPGHAKPDHAGYVHVDSINLYSLFNPVLKWFKFWQVVFFIQTWADL